MIILNNNVACRSGMTKTVNSVCEYRYALTLTLAVMIEHSVCGSTQKTT